MKWVLRGLAVVFILFVIAIIALRVSDTDAAAMQAKYGAEPSQFVELDDGLRVHYRDEGPNSGEEDAPVLVLLHGSTADLHTWQPWAEALRDEYRVIRFDQIGHGLTGPDLAGDYSLSSFVADIDEVADKLGLESFILAGSSMGGAHTVGYALAHPERLDGIVLVGASGAPVRREGGGSFAMSLARTPVINQIMAHITPRSMIESSFSGMVSNKDMITDEMVDRYWELLRYPGNRQATIARFSVERSPFDAEAVSGITVPALVIWGAEDPLIPAASGDWYDEHLPSSALVSYADIGHLPHEEAAERSVNDLKAWIGTISPDSASPEAELAVTQ